MFRRYDSRTDNPETQGSGAAARIYYPSLTKRGRCSNAAAHVGRLKDNECTSPLQRKHLPPLHRTCRGFGCGFPWQNARGTGSTCRRRGAQLALPETVAPPPLDVRGGGHKETDVLGLEMNKKNRYKKITAVPQRTMGDPLRSRERLRLLLRREGPSRDRLLRLSRTSLSRGLPPSRSRSLRSRSSLSLSDLSLSLIR